MLADMHMHTHFSTDSHADMNEMVEQSIRAGIPSICFTDHIDWEFPEEGVVFDFDIHEYEKAIQEARARYGKDIQIGMGVELGMQPQLVCPYMKLLEEHPFDFVIGSMHLVNGRDPYYPEAFAGRSDREVYRDYLEGTLENIKAFHGFDSLGHLDYVVRYGQHKAEEYSYEAFSDVIDEILKQLVKDGKGLEINTAGLRKGLGFPNPHPQVMKRFRELGGEIVTVGSDSHKPYSIGYDFDKAKDILLECGFSYYTQFRERKPDFIKI
ncbi:MAG: histidinol-phosphatase HisJ family protein [Lachnospiraceae bacterium]|nr:histidinol-phosphatase HisJ family protein [Lachnospiraceae bacterium]